VWKHAAARSVLIRGRKRGENTPRIGALLSAEEKTWESSYRWQRGNTQWIEVFLSTAERERWMHAADRSALIRGKKTYGNTPRIGALISAEGKDMWKHAADRSTPIRGRKRHAEIRRAPNRSRKRHVETDRCVCICSRKRGVEICRGWERSYPRQIKRCRNTPRIEAFLSAADKEV